MGSGGNASSNISWDSFPAHCHQGPCSEETMWCWTAMLGLPSTVREHAWPCCLHCDPGGVAMLGWPTPSARRGFYCLHRATLLHRLCGWVGVPGYKMGWEPVVQEGGACTLPDNL